MTENTQTPKFQIRAVHDDKTIRVYQAYNHQIADAALRAGTFQSPPFNMSRMTWIKPSFLWMIYRCGWGLKDANQNRILAIDISRDGFDWALRNATLSHRPSGMSDQDWEDLKVEKPVRIQWDPERDLFHRALDHRSIQIGIGQTAAPLYVNDWIEKITDITEEVQGIHALVQSGETENATLRLPKERVLDVTIPDSLLPQ